MDSHVEAINESLNRDWEFLAEVYELLRAGNAFNVQNNEPIVHFRQPDEIQKLIDLALSEKKNCSSEELLEICRKIIYYSVKTNHGRFHNQLFGQMDPFGLAGAWITEALNTSAYTFEVAPVFSLIETEVIKAFCDMYGYKDGDGIFAPGGSISNMYGLVLARYKAFPNIKTTGIFGYRPMAIFTSEESHYSIKKCANWLGIGTDNCIIIKTNEFGQMLANDLEAKVIQAKADDKIPIFINATAGTTVLGAYDSLPEIADISERHNIWLHVDGCHGGSVILSKENRHLLKGIERSNSLAWDPHKALGTPMQCAMFLTREKDLLPLCNSTEAKYLFQQDKFYDVSYDTGNKSIQCGRKVDSFKLWMMLKARGTDGFGALVDHALQMSKKFTRKLKERDGFRLVQTQYQYTNVCFWYIPKEMRGQDETPEWHQRLYEIAPKIKERMVKTGKLMVGYSPLPYRGIGNFIRMVFTCYPILDDNELDFMIDEIERLGEPNLIINSH